MHPKSRKDGVLSTPLPGGEVVLYDASAESYRQLSPMCAYVWERCDGDTSIEEIAAGVQTTFSVETAESIVEEALRELATSNLIDGVGAIAVAAGISRRVMLRRGAAVAMVPFVTTLAMPRFGSAQTVGSPPDDGPPGGCTPGYWKNHWDRWPTGYTPFVPATTYASVFGPTPLGNTVTMIALLQKEDGTMWEKLGKHSSAAILNAAHPEIAYPMSVGAIILAVQAEVGNSNPEALKNTFDVLNNSNACPLSGTPALVG